MPVVTKKKPVKRFEALNTRVEDQGKAKAMKLAGLLTKEKGVPVAVADAVVIALAEALEKRAK